MLVWLNTDRSLLRKVRRRPLSFFTPFLQSINAVVFITFLEPLSTSALSNIVNLPFTKFKLMQQVHDLPKRVVNSCFGVYCPLVLFIHQTPGAVIMEADDRHVTTVFTVQPSFHHRHSTNRVSWSVTIVRERGGEVWLHVRRRWK